MLSENDLKLYKEMMEHDCGAEGSAAEIICPCGGSVALVCPGYQECGSAYAMTPPGQAPCAHAVNAYVNGVVWW